jgi:hypothetical protein
MEIEAMRSQKVRLSKATVAEAQPAEREYVMWDDRIDGFGLRVRPTGNKSFVFVYRTPGGRAGKVRRVTFKAIDLDTAYKKATALAGNFYVGRDPAADKAAERDEVIKARKVMTVANVLDRFISDHAKTNLKAKTWTEYERLATKLIKPAIGTMKIDTLEPKYVAAMYNQLNATPTQATLAVRVLSSAMSWAEENGLRKHGQNPARIRLKGTRRRQRLFSDREVSRLLTAIDEGTLSALTKLPDAEPARFATCDGAMSILKGAFCVGPIPRQASQKNHLQVRRASCFSRPTGSSVWIGFVTAAILESPCELKRWKRAWSVS